MTANMKAAYQRLETAIREITELEGFEGIMTEWVVVLATQRFDGDGDGISQVGRLMPEGHGSVPYHRVMGLLDYALTLCRAEIIDGQRDD